MQGNGFSAIPRDRGQRYLRSPMRTAAPLNAHVIDFYDEVAWRVPLALAHLHRSLDPHRAVTVRLSKRAPWDIASAGAVMEGAGFVDAGVKAEGRALVAAGVRSRTLPDVVGPGLRLLVCGLNPSLYAADRGVGYARPGNRFWPAALAAGLVVRDRDPYDALALGVGMTDLVKRATVGASELGIDEYRAGAARLERLVRWLRPGAVCFVGLAGYRAAIDAKAVAGVQPLPFGGQPAYVMPSTSGRNARCPVDELAAHLRAAWSLGTAGGRAQAVTAGRLVKPSVQDSSA